MLIAITLEKERRKLPKRDVDSHKGSFGHVLILGGSPGMSGAAILAGMAALRSGSGKVSIATAPEHANILNLACPELMCYGIVESQHFEILARRATNLVLGPGLGISNYAKQLLACGLKLNLPTLVDADGLKWLSELPQANTHPHWVLTPHPGEAAALLGVTLADVQQDRMAAVKALQKKFGGVVVLKGAGTLIQGPEAHTYVCPAANPAMATAGMGDVLSGVIGSLMGQGMSPLDSALLGTILHAHAADRASQTGARGMLASDVLPFIRDCINGK